LHTSFELRVNYFVWPGSPASRQLVRG
jgi:hypothetical protein